MEHKDEWREQVMTSSGHCIVCGHTKLAHIVNELDTGLTACCVMQCNCPEFEVDPNDSQV